MLRMRGRKVRLEAEHNGSVVGAFEAQARLSIFDHQKGPEDRSHSV